MRPHGDEASNENPQFRDIAYALTHVVYTLNDYNRFRLSPDWLPMEFEFLERHAVELQRRRDEDLAGEFIDLDTQDADGS